MLQDFCPLANSLQWQLATAYWDQQGLQPFVTGQVPYVINNNGWASEQAAQVLFANCSETIGLPNRIALLELGAGLGLFAKLFLDAFKQLCTRHNRDFYSRLTYFITDQSPTTIQQWTKHGLFAEHADQVVIGQCNALEPTTVHGIDGQRVQVGQLQAVLANYSLDSLPAAIVRSHEGQLEQLCVRTYLSLPPDQLSQHIRLSINQIRDRAASGQPRELSQLLPLVQWLEFEAAFRSGDAASLPFVDELMEYTRGSNRTMLNYGALQCIQACLARLHPQGFMLINDYGPTQPQQVSELSFVQFFGSSIASCIHFPFMEHHISRSGYRFLKADTDDDRMIHARLVCQADLPQTTNQFRTYFGDDSHLRADQLATQATEYISANRYNDALACYKKAIDLCPRDWNLLAQAAQFLTQQLQMYDQALELAQAAVAINPWFSPFLWNTLGNALFCLGRVDQAHQAYLQAQSLDNDDPQTNLDLAHSFAKLGYHDQALVAIARGLANDTQGQFKSHLLDQQQRILTALADRWAAQEKQVTQTQNVFVEAK